MHPKFLAVGIAGLILLYVVDLIRRQKMTFKYSLAWLVTCALVLFFTYFDRVLYVLSGLTGFTLPSNFIFFLLLVFFVILSLMLTIYVNEQNSRSEALCQSMGILEYELKELKDKCEDLAKRHPPA